MNCPHDLAERETDAADGSCSICLRVLVSALESRVKNADERQAEMSAERHKLLDELSTAQNALVWMDAVTERWPAKPPLDKRQSNVLVRFINEFVGQVSKARQKTMREIGLAIQDALDEVPQLPVDPEAADRVWVDAHGVPMNIDKIDPARLINILRFAYRGFLDRERPGQWDNITAACEKYGKPWQEHLRKWDRDEREKLEEMSRRANEAAVEAMQRNVYADDVDDLGRA